MSLRTIIHICIHDISTHENTIYQSYTPCQIIRIIIAFATKFQFDLVHILCVLDVISNLNNVDKTFLNKSRCIFGNNLNIQCQM